MKTTVVVVLTLVIASSCFSNYETEGTITDEQSDASGANGERGPFGVERAQLYLNTPTGSGYEVEVTLPVGDDAHYTPVIVVQGGRVAKERYRWIAEHLSTRGFTVLNAQHPLDLAIMDIGASLRALEGVKADPYFSDRIADVPGVVMGHSLGGAVAAKVWNDAGSDVMKHLALLASYPDAGDTFEPDHDSGRIAFSISGTKNGNTSSQGFFDESRSLVHAADVHVVTIEGMNHYQFVSAPTDDELANDGEATIDIELAQQTSLELIDRLCDDAAGTRDFQVPPDFPWPEGVETFDNES